MQRVSLSRWTPATPDIRGGLDGSGPLVLFDREGGVMIISVMDHSMAASVWLDDDVLAWGVMGGVDDLPPGYSMQTLLYMGNGGVGPVSYTHLTLPTKVNV